MQVVNVPRVSVAPPLDGVGRTGSWTSAVALPRFVLHDGQPTRQATTARLCWADTALYIAFEVGDDDIWGTYRERNSPIYDEEVVEVFLDLTGEGECVFEFEVSPHNVVLDGVNLRRGDKFDWDDTWSCDGLVTAVAVDGQPDDLSTTDTGWTATLAIPFAGLGRSTPVPGERWRANLFRIDRPRRGGSDEYQAWCPTQGTGAPPLYCVPARFGTLVFA